MLKGLDDFIKNPSKYKKDFLMNCKIYEKISAYYFHVKIVSTAIQIVSKADYKKIMPEDIIMNSMWKDPMIDIPNMFIKNPEFTKDHIGWTFSFFYFPVSKPLLIDYNITQGWKYMLGYVIDDKGKSVDISNFDFSKISPLVNSKGYLLKDSNRSQSEKKEIVETVKKNTIEEYIHLIEGMVDKDYLLVPDLTMSEGIILRNNKDIYQIVYNAGAHQTSDNRLPLEFFLHMFCSFLKDVDYTELIKESYVKSVCGLFNVFRKKWMNDPKNKPKFQYYNISPEDLESPTFGYYPGTCYDMIPFQSVRELCKKDKMSDNMLKILLNGLRKRRSVHTSSMLMTEEDNIIWNECVSTIKKITIPFYQNEKNHKNTEHR